MKHLVMLGAGHAHLHLLSTLAAQPLAGVQITLVTSHPRQLYSGLVPGFVAGHYTLEDCMIPLEPLLKGTAINWLVRSVKALDASARSLTLDDDSWLGFDFLSINTGSVQSRQQIELMIPGARENGLFLRPIESFGALWPKVVELADTRRLRVAVIGAGAAGAELAMAIGYRLPGSSVTLLAGTGLAGNYTTAVRQRIARALQQRHITVLPDKAVGIAAGEVKLGSGARLVCDVPVIAIGAQAPAWLHGSGLALDESGFIAVDACQRSISDPQVFAAGDISTCVDRALAPSSGYAMGAGPALAENLRAALSGQAPKPYVHVPREKTLSLLSCGGRYAIATWGDYSAQGRWVWWLKDWIDRSFIKRYRRR